MRTDQLRVTKSRTLRKGFYAVLVMSMVAATESFSQTPTLAEALDTPGLTWTSGGAGVWTGQTNTSHDGVDSAQGSLPMGDRESWIETTVAGPAQTTFWCKLYPTSDVEVQLQVNGE